jgi:hypothetical protein
VNPRGSIFNRTRQYMAYADDDVIIGRSTQIIDTVIQGMEELTNNIGLTVNVDKTKYMNTSKHKHQKICSLKTRTLIMKNIKKHQN